MNADRPVAHGAARRVGRYRVPADSAPAIRWFLRELWAPRSRRERWLGRVAAFLPPAAALAVLARRAGDAEDPVAPAAGYPLIEAAGGEVLGAQGVGWSGYPGSGRTVEFVFAAGEAAPRWVLKSGPGAGGGRLRGESERLGGVRARVGPGLAATLPEPLGYCCEREREWLLLSALPGRTVDAELARWPGDEARHRRRLIAAAAWLARLFRETREPAPPTDVPKLPPPEVAGDLEALARALASGEVPCAASHGDFWPRNVLVAEGRDPILGVVDWEAARESAPPHRDLFDFAACQAARRASGDEAERAVAAFRGAFLDPDRGCATRAYLETWATAAGVATAWLEPLFRLWLSELAVGVRELRLVPVPRREEVARTWLGLYATATRSVFSG